MENTESPKKGPNAGNRLEGYAPFLGIISIMVVLTLMSGCIQTETPASEAKTVKMGSFVTVDYIGKFTDQRVFDTSIQSVAENASVNKSATYSQRQTYEPLKVYVSASSAPSDRSEYITVIEGFRDGLIGMKVGENKTIIVPPEEGYGNSFPDLIKRINRTENISMYENLTLSEFSADYLVEPVLHMTLRHHFWTWNASVVNINRDMNTVTLRNDPQVSDEVYAYPWKTVVLSRNTATAYIQVSHQPALNVTTKTASYDTFLSVQPSFADVPQLQQAHYRMTGIPGTIDYDQNYIMINFNREVYGKTLFFEVFLVSVD